MIAVVPQEFVKVEFDADRIGQLCRETVSSMADLPDDLSFEVRVAEDEATSRFGIASLDPLVFDVDGGAFENYRDPRRLGDAETRTTMTRLLLEVVDRQTSAFGAPGLGDEVSQAHHQAWDVNLYGRVGRLGHRLHKPRFIYNFRNRHGFTDHADRVFEQLWASDGLTWPRITELSDQASSVVS